MKIPLAWLQLSHEKIRLLVALAGIGFADLLMFMQLGFRDALFDSAIVLNESFRGEVFLLSPQSDTLVALESFSQGRLYQALSIKGVQAVSPVYLDLAIWKNPVTSETRAIQVIGFNPQKNILDLPGIEDNLDEIKLEDVVIFDQRSRPEFGPIPELFQQGENFTTEVASHQVRIGGLFTLGASFGADGNIVTSDLNFMRIFDGRQKGLIDVGVISLEPGVDADAVAKVLRKKLPSDVRVFTREEFIAFEKKYWQTSTAIGFIFTLGTAMGFIVGTVIVYQVLYTDVADHLPEYATLKAMGYTDWYLLGVVFQEAIILALLGFLPGIGISTVLYHLAAGATNLPIKMTINRAVTVIIMTLVMCLVSGGIAVRKLRAADPADIF